MSARNLTLVDFISLMEKQSGRFKEDQVSDFRGERKFIGVMQTRCSSTCPIFALQKFKFNMNQPGTRLCSGGKRQKTRRNSKNKKKQKQKHTARESSRAVDWEGERAVILSFSGGFQWLDPLFCSQRRFPLSLSPVTFTIRKLEEDIAVLFKTSCSTVF